VVRNRESNSCFEIVMILICGDDRRSDHLHISFYLTSVCRNGAMNCEDRGHRPMDNVV
jgi:hypothetical protein